IPPVLVEMAAGETKAASAIGALAGPGDALRLAAFDRLTRRWIAAMRAVALDRAFRRHGAEDLGNPALALAQANMEIPLVIDREGLYAVGDRVVGKLLKLRVPVRVDRPID